MSSGVQNYTSPDTRQAEEFFLTAAQSLFALALLLRLRLGLGSALALAGLFSVQVGLAFAYRNDEVRMITTLTMLAWIYLGLAAILFLVNGRRLLGLLRTALPERGTEETGSPKESELAGDQR
jgi:cation:H+ antiporter